MCGRYYRTSDKYALLDFFHAETTGDALTWAPAYNIAPTTTQPVIRQNRDTLSREVVPMRWGLVGFHTAGPDPKRSTFNARSDSLQRSALWRGPFLRHRCLVPLDGWYEWHKPTKEGWRLTMRDGLFACAGVWDAWKNPADGQWLQSFAIITVQANAAISRIHDRMPAILRHEEYDRWLDRRQVERPPDDLLRPFDSNEILAFAANPKVANVRNQGPELISL